MKKYKKFIVSTVFVIGALLIVPFFIPVETYLRQAEMAASEVMGVPVQIKDGNIALLPTPRVHGSGLVVGNNTDLTVDDVVITPTLTSLFSGQKVIALELNKVVMKKTALAAFDALMKPNKDNAPPTVAISSLSINQLQLDWPSVTLPLIKLAVDLQDNAMISANISAIDGSISALVTPEKTGQQIAVNLKQFKLPTETPLVVNSGQFAMLLQGSRLDISTFSLALYDGTIKGQAQLSWAKAAKLSGEFAVNAISLKEPSYQVNPQTYMTGYLSGNGKFSAQASTIGALTKHLQVQLPFTIKDGVLHGLDLVKAANLIGKKDTSGQTKFDRFSGDFAVVGASYKLTNLQIDSGLLTATGDVAIGAKDTLKGDVSVSLKQSAGLAEVPLVISGTLDKPNVSPSKMALIGAAAGTAVLGPGVGTSLGIKASKGLSKIKNLFGGDEE